MADPVVVQVQVHGQSYPIRTHLPPAYVQELATYVDRKMTLAAAASPTSDMLALAILSALNVADEVFRLRDARADEVGSIAKRTQALEQMVDQALELANGR